MTTRYDVLSPRIYKDRDGNEKTTFLKVGVAFPMRDKDGFNVTLEAIPLPTSEGVRLMLMPPRDDKQPTPQRGSRPAPAGLDEEIPFAPEVR